MTKPVSVRALYDYVVAVMGTRDRGEADGGTDKRPRMSASLTTGWLMTRSARDALVVGARPSRVRRRSQSTAANTNMSASESNGALS